MHVFVSCSFMHRVLAVGALTIHNIVCAHHCASSVVRYQSTCRVWCSHRETAWRYRGVARPLRYHIQWIRALLIIITGRDWRASILASGASTWMPYNQGFSWFFHFGGIGLEKRLRIFGINPTCFHSSSKG